MPPDAALLPFAWAPGWNSNQSIVHFQQEVNGALHAAPAGVRLIGSASTQAAKGPAQAAATSATTSATTSTASTARFVRSAELLPIPLYETFGSDELSALSPAITERTARPYLVLHPDDAVAMGLVDDEQVLARVERQAPGVSFRLRLDSAMTAGAVGYAHGLPGSFAFLVTEMWIEKDPAAQQVIARS